MTGYMFAMGHCITCGMVFSFNPDSVPSTRAITGKREPVCLVCMTAINAKRETMGQPAFPIMAGAYDPCEES